MEILKPAVAFANAVPGWRLNPAIVPLVGRPRTRPAGRFWLLAESRQFDLRTQRHAPGVPPWHPSDGERASAVEPDANGRVAASPSHFQMSFPGHLDIPACLLSTNPILAAPAAPASTTIAERPAFCQINLQFLSPSLAWQRLGRTPLTFPCLTQFSNGYSFITRAFYQKINPPQKPMVVPNLVFWPIQARTSSRFSMV